MSTPAGCHGGRDSARYGRSEPGFWHAFKSEACKHRYLQLWSGTA